MDPDSYQDSAFCACSARSVHTNRALLSAAFCACSERSLHTNRALLSAATQTHSHTHKQSSLRTHIHKSHHLCRGAVADHCAIAMHRSQHQSLSHTQACVLSPTHTCSMVPSTHNAFSGTQTCDRAAHQWPVRAVQWCVGHHRWDPRRRGDCGGAAIATQCGDRGGAARTGSEKRTCPARPSARHIDSGRAQAEALKSTSTCATHTAHTQVTESCCATARRSARLGGAEISCVVCREHCQQKRAPDPP